MGLVAAKCTNCNANIEVEDSLDAGICRYCNTPFITEKVINQYITNVSNYDNSQKTYNVENVNIYNGDHDRVASSKVFALEASYSKQELVKNFFASAQGNSLIPSNFFEKLENVKVELLYEEYWEVVRDIEFAWNAIIGVDRTEDYTEQVNQPDGTTVMQKETRSITDWHPQNGVRTFSGATKIYRPASVKDANAENSFRAYKSYLSSAAEIDESEQVKRKVSTSKKMEEEVLATIKKTSEEDAIREWEKAPIGDSHKSLVGNVKSKNIVVRRYLLPKYKLSYSYSGLRYENTLNAMQYCDSNLSLPTCMVTSVQARTVRETKKEKSKSTCFLVLTIIATFIAVMMYSNVHGSVMPNIIFLLVGCAVFGIGAVILLIFTLKFNKAYKSKLSGVMNSVLAEIRASGESKLATILLDIEQLNIKDNL